MKNLFIASNGGHPARILKAAAVSLTTCAVAAMFWVASTPVVHAQTAGKADFLAGLCAAVQKPKSDAPKIAGDAAQAHPEWKRDILRTIFRCLGTNNCRKLNGVLRALSTGSDASELTQLALELAPDCAPAFGGAGRGGEEAGGFGNAPSNLNPPPGSIGGGGGQGNVVAVCFMGVTRFLSPEAAQEFLANNPGATLGACVVTPVLNR